MNWLHFCDFHIGGAKGPQINALTSLVETVRRECQNKNLTIDAVFLVGDIAYSGLKAEYDRFRDEFLTPLRSIPHLKNAHYFAVPGNHDVDCNVGVPISWDTIQAKQDIFFCEDDDGRRARKARSETFENYYKFIAEERIFSPDPTQEVSKIFEVENFPVAIVATNTAFFSHSSEHKFPRSTPIALASLRKTLPAGVAKKPVLLLGHHSPDSFRIDQIKSFKSLLNERKAVYIHGHEHEALTSFNGDSTLRTLGFGAIQPMSPKTNVYSHARW